MITIKPLNEVGIETILRTFQEAFADYEVQLSINELQAMFIRRGFVSELSFGAFDSQKLVSFTLNGIGFYDGVKTAYDTGTGTLKNYQGRGLATRIFNYSIPYLQEAGITQYILEVLQHNTKAIAVYNKIGFETSRSFNYYIASKSDIRFKTSSMPSDIEISGITIEQCLSAGSFCDFIPAWQNSFDSVKRSLSQFKLLGAFDVSSKLLGYIIVEPYSGDITQIAISKFHRRKGIGSLLLKEALSYITSDNVKIINTEAECDSLQSFLKAKKIELNGKQFEMRLMVQKTD